MELITQIMKLAGFLGDGKSSLIVPHHPFHPQNRSRLRQHLGYCWIILIRCRVIKQTLDSVNQEPGASPVESGGYELSVLFRAGLFAGP